MRLLPRFQATQRKTRRKRVKKLAKKKELLPIDLSGLLWYILDNGSGDLNFIFVTTPIIRLYLQKATQSRV